MKVIDENMGGTTPLDILVNFQNITNNNNAGGESGKDSDDEFEGFEEFEEVDNAEKYWFTSDKMALIKKVHNYLESLPEIGKVLSLGTMMKVAEIFTEGEPLDNFQLFCLIIDENNAKFDIINQEITPTY